jgi:RimJ/RimL family protein N-acetyltransferase
MSARAASNWGSVALTPVEAGDLAKLNAWQNDPDVRDQIMGFRGPVRLETTEAWIASIADHNLKTRAVFAVRQGGAIKGVVQLHGIDWVQRTAMLGIYIGEAGDRGAGLGWISTALILDYAFNGLDLARVGLEVLATNVPAEALYEALGFRQEGYLRQAFLKAGVREDVALYGLLKPEWDFDFPADAKRLIS